MPQEEKTRIERLVRAAGLDWFKCEPGFRFLDQDGDEAIVIGWGGWRDTRCLGDINLCGGVRKALYEIRFNAPTLVCAYRYKGEHHLFDLAESEHLADIKPIDAETDKGPGDV